MLVSLIKHLFRIFEDTSAPSSAPFSSEIADNKKEILGNSLVLLCFEESGRKASNLRPSAPKALNNPSRALCLQAMTE